MSKRLSRGALLSAVLSVAACAMAPPPVLAGPAPKAHPAPPPDDSDATVVQGVDVVSHQDYAHQIGAVVGDITPEIQFSPADIQSFGVSTVNELLSELGPEIRSDRGRGGEPPVVLLNGRRISSLNEVMNLPTEAILRLDILPEEVALKYGYAADQRVVNIVLRRRFHATTAEAEDGGPTEGDETTPQAELDLLHIRRDDRLNLDLKYQAATGITDAARGVVEPAPLTPYDLTGNVVSATPGSQIDPSFSALVGRPVTIAGVPAGMAGRALTLGDFVPTAGVANVTDTGADRSLAPDTRSLTANAVLAHPLPWGVNGTVNATLGATSSESLQGLPGVALDVPAGDPFSPFGSPVVVDRYLDSPLHQYTNGWTAHLGTTLNKDLHDWRLSLTDAYDHADTQTDTDAGVDATALQAALAAASPAVDPFGTLPGGLLVTRPQNVSRSISDSANVQMLANGPLLKLPAGNLYVSAKAGDTQSWQESRSNRLDQFEAVSLSRNDLNGQINIDLPLTSGRNHVLPFLGDLSLMANGAVDELSDYGLLKAFGYGVNWTVRPGYNLIVSHTNDQAAPTIQQLGGAIIYTPGVRVFDYATGQTVDVTQVGGGAPGLTADNRNVLKIGLTLKPVPTQDLTITANYIKSDIDNPILTFPAASAAIEAAFPARFIRNADGDLIEEDIRPVNFARSERSEIRWGFNYSRPIGKQPPPRAFRRAFAGGDGAPPGGGPAGGAPGGGDRDRAGGGPGGPGGQGGGGPGRFRGFTGPPAAGRLQFAVYHTLYLTDRELVRPGGPSLDLLNGAPASGTGGQYRNEIEAQLGMTLLGFGGRLSADWREGTTVVGAPGSPTGPLTFSGITTLNVRLFENLGQQRWVTRRYPWLRGARISVAVTNLLDERIQVRDALGATPLGYQPAYLDPAGRTVLVSFRKLFF